MKFTYICVASTIFLTCSALLFILFLVTRTRGTPVEVDARSVALVINLDRNTDRMDSFSATYLASDFRKVPLHRLSAVDGQEVDWSRFVASEALERLMTMQRNGYREDHPDLTPGAVGCYLSHINAWAALRDRGVPFGFVFEDDVADIPADALAKAQKAMSYLPRDWDILLMGCDGTEGLPVGPGVVRMRRFLRLHAYVISQKAIHSLVDRMLPIKQQIDWELSERIASGLNVFALSPQYIRTRWMGTDIQSPLKKSAP